MLKGEKINLRLVKEKDLSKLYDLTSDLSNRGLYFPKTLMPETEFRKLYQKSGFWSDEFGRFLIVDHEDNIIGSIYYFKIAIYSDALELGYILFDKLHRGKGYATEALKMIVKYLFSVKAMDRIQLRISPENELSKKVAIKAGFKFDGIRRAIVFHDGKHMDLEEYVMLRQEYPMYAEQA